MAWICEEKNIRRLLALILDLISRRWRPLDHGQTCSLLMKLSMARDSPTLKKLIPLLEHLATPCRSSDPAYQILRLIIAIDILNNSGETYFETDEKIAQKWLQTSSQYQVNNHTHQHNTPPPTPTDQKPNSLLHLLPRMPRNQHHRLRPPRLPQANSGSRTRPDRLQAPRQANLDRRRSRARDLPRHRRRLDRCILRLWQRPLRRHRRHLGGCLRSARCDYHLCGGRGVAPRVEAAG